jgi:hypothetical protein
VRHRLTPISRNERRSSRMAESSPDFTMSEGGRRSHRISGRCCRTMKTIEDIKGHIDIPKYVKQQQAMT